MGTVLRKEILEDQGYSRLKTKALDLITKLRLQQQILNDKKTAERAERDKGKGAMIRPIRE